MTWLGLTLLGVLVFSSNSLLHRVLMRDMQPDPSAQAMMFFGIGGTIALLLAALHPDGLQILLFLPLAALEPPDLAPDRISAAVRRHYDLALTTLTFLPLGLDVQAWAYRATTADGRTLFLKLRQGSIHEAALRVPRYLVDHGATHVVAPLPTRAQRLWGEVAGFTFTLSPFIEGVTGMAHGMQRDQWIAFGAALSELHAMPLAPELVRDVPREAFTLTQLFQRLRQAPWTAVVTALDALGAASAAADPALHALAIWWQAQRPLVLALADRFTALGEQLRAQRPPLVLCHADIHPNNLLIDVDGRLWMVDWDEVLLAPKECDLMMGVGGLGNYPAGLRETAWFLQGYGSTAVDPIVLAYYRHARALGDIGANAEQILQPAASEAAKHAAMQRLRLLFAPGYIVSQARQRHLPG